MPHIKSLNILIIFNVNLFLLPFTIRQIIIIMFGKLRYHVVTTWKILCWRNMFDTGKIQSVYWLSVRISRMCTRRAQAWPFIRFYNLLGTAVEIFRCWITLRHMSKCKKHRFWMGSQSLLRSNFLLYISFCGILKAYSHHERYGIYRVLEGSYVLVHNWTIRAIQWPGGTITYIGFKSA